MIAVPKPSRAELEQLLRDHMYMVDYIISRLRSYDARVKRLGYHDCRQIGYMTICKAAEHFDPARGCKFSTYAYRAIYQNIRNAARDFVRSDHSQAESFNGVPDATRHLPVDDIEALRTAINSLWGGRQAPALGCRKLRILALYYGLDGAPAHTYAEIAALERVSKAYVGAMIHRALDDLRAALSH